MGTEEFDTSGISRREALKRGLKLTGAVMWATPVVQAIGMRPALAQTTSPTCTVWYAVKIDPSDGGCVDIFDQDSPNGRGQCLDVDSLPVAPVSGGCGKVVGFTTPGDPAPWTVTFDSDCEVQVTFVKAGSNPCASGVGVWDPSTHTVSFPNPGRPEISHVEIAFCCED